MPIEPPRLVGGVSRNVGDPQNPDTFSLTVTRHLSSGKLDFVELTEKDLLMLAVSATTALALIHNERNAQERRRALESRKHA